MNDIWLVAYTLKFASFYFITTGILLHIKAYLDFKMLEFRIRYSELDKKSLIKQTNINIDDCDSD